VYYWHDEYIIKIYRSNKIYNKGWIYNKTNNYIGLKQGDRLSSTLFNIFIDKLQITLKMYNNYVFNETNQYCNIIRTFNFDMYLYTDRYYFNEELYNDKEILFTVYTCIVIHLIIYVH
jgi:hypothetical protein